MERMISQSIRDGTFYLNLWYGTDEVERFKVRAVKTKPYIIAHGVRYDLTEVEIESMKRLTEELDKCHKAFLACNLEMNRD